MTIGEKILKQRQDKGLSQKELAEAIDKKTSDIAMWESDEEIPSIMDVNKLCSFFGVTSDTFINDVDLSTDYAQNDSIDVHEELGKSDKVKETTHQTKDNKKTKIVIAFCAIALLCLLAGLVIFVISKSSFSNNSSAIEKAAESVVKVICYDIQGEEVSLGSGFICFDDSTVITNFHVIDEANTCKISTDEDKTYEIENVICYSQEFDVAVLKIKEPTGLKPLKTGKSDLIKKGETVVAIGSPLGIKNSVSKGILSGRVMEDNMDVLQFTAEISNGSSGGALFNDKGDVIGITYASYEEGQNLNLAVPIEKAIELYENKSEPTELSSIYLINHPYAKYLNALKDAVEVSLNDLQSNPNHYRNKRIKIIGYVSSSENGIAKFLADREEDISGSLNSDLNDYIYNDFDNVSTIYLSGRASLYEDEDIQAGDMVCIIGKFAYFPAGTNVLNRLIEEDSFITFNDNKGEIGKTILYKIPYLE